MALKALLLRKKLNDLRKQAETLRAKTEAFQQRETELEAAINEATTEEDRQAVGAEVEAFEAERAEHETTSADLERTITETEEALAAEEAQQPGTTTPPAVQEERKDNHTMNQRIHFRSMNLAERESFVARSNIQEFITRMREFPQKRGVSGVEVLVPVEIIEMLRSDIGENSKLYKFVNIKHITGVGRQNIMGTAPEAVWMEATGTLNELELSFAGIEVDGFKVGGYFSIPNAIEMMTDISLISEVISALGRSIGIALDKAILFGTGVKMPLGICARLQQTSKPADWSDKAPAWTDLHETNILTLNLASTTAEAFFAALITAFGVASPKYSDGKCFWAMNHKTHMDIMSKSLAFNSAAALTAGINNTFPIIGGEIVEVEDDVLCDYQIVGGFGSMYLLGERSGAKVESSDQCRFIQDETVVRGVASYDGKPSRGEAFVTVKYNNTAPTTSATFATDYAGNGTGALGVTAAAGSAIGKTVLTVTGTEVDGTTLKYKVGEHDVEAGDKVTGWTPLTSGTTAIEAAAGQAITVVELDAKSRVIKSGKVAAVPKVS